MNRLKNYLGKLDEYCTAGVAWPAHLATLSAQRAFALHHQRITDKTDVIDMQSHTFNFIESPVLGN
jgi:hypothetical protein